MSGSEMIMYAGIAIMGVSVLLGIVSAVIFKISGKKLDKVLVEEYGDLKKLL